MPGQRVVLGFDDFLPSNENFYFSQIFASAFIAYACVPVICPFAHITAELRTYKRERRA